MAERLPVNHDASNESSVDNTLDAEVVDTSLENNEQTNNSHEADSIFAAETEQLEATAEKAEKNEAESRYEELIKTPTPIQKIKSKFRLLGKNKVKKELSKYEDSINNYVEDVKIGDENDDIGQLILNMKQRTKAIHTHMRESSRTRPPEVTFTNDDKLSAAEMAEITTCIPDPTQLESLLADKYSDDKPFPKDLADALSAKLYGERYDAVMNEKEAKQTTEKLESGAKEELKNSPAIKTRIKDLFTRKSQESEEALTAESEETGDPVEAKAKFREKIVPDAHDAQFAKIIRAGEKLNSSSTLSRIAKTKFGRNMAASKSAAMSTRVNGLVIQENHRLQRDKLKTVRQIERLMAGSEHDMNTDAGRAAFEEQHGDLYNRLMELQNKSEAITELQRSIYNQRDQERSQYAAITGAIENRANSNLNLIIDTDSAFKSWEQRKKDAEEKVRLEDAAKLAGRTVEEQKQYELDQAREERERKEREDRIEGHKQAELERQRKIDEAAKKKAEKKKFEEEVNETAKAYDAEAEPVAEESTENSDQTKATNESEK